MSDVDNEEITDEASEVEHESQVEDEYSLVDDLNSELFGDEDGDSEVSTEEDGSEESGDDDTSEVFTVKVDGEEIEVTRDELLAGYSRQADYTKKTQALAERAEQLQGMEQLAQALNANPEVALQELAKAFQVDLGAPASVEADDVDLDDLDPLEREIRELKAELQAVKGEVTTTAEARRQAEEDQALQREIDQIRADNDDPHLDEDDLLRYAIDNKINDLGKAYKFMKLEAGSTKTTEDEVLERKRETPPVQGASTRKGAKRGSGKITSIAEALAQTMSELNG